MSSKVGHRAIRRSGSMLKFSNSSVTSARAAHLKNESENNDPFRKRRKFFNSSTEFVHILSLILMSLCRKVTNEAYLRNRLIFYSVLIVLGGFLHDFTPTFVNAFFFIFNISPRSILNLYFVKMGWFWNVIALTPLIIYTSKILKTLNNIDLMQIEKDILKLVEKKDTIKNHNNNRIHNDESLNPVTRPMQQNQQQIFVEQYRIQMEELVENDEKTRSKSRIIKILFNLKRFVQYSQTRDLLRIVISFGVYYINLYIFNIILLATNKNPRSTAISTAIHANPSSLQSISGFDISGHVYILILSNLIFLEECSIMIGWEQLGDRLLDLSREYVNLEIEFLSPIFFVGGTWTISDKAKSLCKALFRFNNHSNVVKLSFLGSTILSIIWDLMLLQTAFFYHTLMEKILSLFCALFSWFLLYKILFPALNLTVRKYKIQHDA